MNRDEILITLSEMKGRLNVLSSFDKKFIEDNYETVLRSPFTRRSCNDCYRDAVIQMFTYLKKNNLMEAKSNYRLCRGILLHPKGTSEVYSYVNMTDEFAEAFLKEKPERIRMFESFPSDWKKRIKPVEKVETGETVKKPSKKKNGSNSVKKETGEETGQTNPDTISE